MTHEPDCMCDEHTSYGRKKTTTTRREFLCLAVGAAGIVGTASAANAKTFVNLISPTAERAARKPTLVDAAVVKKPPVQISTKEVSSGSPLTFVMPKCPDMHTHIRQGQSLPLLIERQLAMGSDVIVAMPNTKPPVSRVTGLATEKSWSIESYLDTIRKAGGDKFRDIIVPLYLTDETTPKMIEEGKKYGLLRAVKYYPPKYMASSNFGSPIDRFMDGDIFKALEDNDVVACFHGEINGLKPEEFFDRDTNAEMNFYKEKMPRIADKYPKLRISCEHITTAEAVSFIRQADDNVVATVTPQHLLYTVGHLLQAWEADLYCMPLVKFEADRAALQAAVTSKDNHKFIAGTDSAPHPRIEKTTPCGCGAGAFVGGIAPQLYAQAFEQAGVDLSTSESQAIFRRFMAENAWRFWKLAPSRETMRLIKKPSEVTVLDLPDGQQITPLPVGITCDPTARSAMIPWSLQI